MGTTLYKHTGVAITVVDGPSADSNPTFIDSSQISIYPSIPNPYQNATQFHTSAYTSIPKAPTNVAGSLDFDTDMEVIYIPADDENNTSYGDTQGKYIIVPRGSRSGFEEGAIGIKVYYP